MSETAKSFWHSAGYIPWFTADTASAVGAALRALAISLLGYAVSGSTVAAGWLGTSSMIAQQVASVFGGTFVDRHDRKRLIVANAVVGVLAWGAVAMLLLCGAEPEPLLRGGTGSQSILQEMPEELPDRLEAGTHNMPGIAGLLEGLRFVEQQGVGRIAGHERHLTRQMAALLRDIPGAEVFYTPEDGAQTGVLSFRLDGWDCEALGEALAAQGAAGRAGLLCTSGAPHGGNAGDGHCAVQLFGL